MSVLWTLCRARPAVVCRLPDDYRRRGSLASICFFPFPFRVNSFYTLLHSHNDHPSSPILRPSSSPCRIAINAVAGTSTATLHWISTLRIAMPIDRADTIGNAISAIKASRPKELVTSIIPMLPAIPNVYRASAYLRIRTI